MPPLSDPVQLVTQLEAVHHRPRHLQQLLLARAADWDGSQWQVPGLDEIRFEMVDSGLYAFILDRRGRVLWSSPSAETMYSAGSSGENSQK